jgi:hypothetical protein
MMNSPGPESRDTRSAQPVHINAYLEGDRGRQRILIIECSQLGLILDRTSGLELNEPVTVELRSGQRLPMRVIWVRGSQAGVRFLGPIAPAHPVLQLLEAAAKKYEVGQASPAAR